MKPATSWNRGPGKLGSLCPAIPSACLKASAQKVIQNRCASKHRGSVPTQSMISQISGCRRCSMADSVVRSRGLCFRTAIAKLFRSESVNFMFFLLLAASIIRPDTRLDPNPREHGLPPLGGIIENDRLEIECSDIKFSSGPGQHLAVILMSRNQGRLQEIVKSSYSTTVLRRAGPSTINASGITNPFFT